MCEENFEMCPFPVPQKQNTYAYIILEEKISYEIWDMLEVRYIYMNRMRVEIDVQVLICSYFIKLSHSS